MENIWFTAAKRYYEMGIYTKQQVALFVVKGRITEAEYKEITGEDFEA
ncbi:XkdX family protein [Cellulosilyticum sp. ST5]